MNLIDFSAWAGWARKNPKLAIAAGLLLAAAGGLFAYYPNLPLPIPEPQIIEPAVDDPQPVEGVQVLKSYAEPPRHLMGWAGPETAAKAWKEVESKPGFVPFRVVGQAPEVDNAKRRVCLWEPVRKVNAGRDIANIRQEIGDCTSWGMRNALACLLAVQIIAGDSLNYHDFDTAYIYGCSRVQIGGGQMGNSDGSTGSWVAEAVMRFGAIPYQFEGLAPYTGARAKQWGRNPGPPTKYLEVGKQHLVRSAARVASPEQVRDAICNGYPVTIASSWGGAMRPQMVDGRLVNRHADTWMHQMAIIGYDGATGSEPYWYVINSWGPDAHGAPPDKSPAGGFWIRKRDVQFIVAQGDSFAVSAYVGFPATPIDWSKLDQLGQVQPLRKEQSQCTHYALAL